MRRMTLFLLLLCPLIVVSVPVPMAADTLGTLTGHVVDSTGAGLEDTVVRILGTRLGGFVRDSDGIVTIAGVPPGCYEAVFSRVGWYPVKTWICIPPSESTCVDSTLKPIPLSARTVCCPGCAFDDDDGDTRGRVFPLHGRVTDPDGHPLADVVVTVTELSERAATEQRSGLYRVELGNPGTYEVVYSKSGYREVRELVDVVGEDGSLHDVILSPGSDLGLH